MKRTLDDWLESLDQEKIDLGLKRVQCIFDRLALKPVRTITVAGTNGKGSTVAMTSALLRACGEVVGSFTSPHIFKFNERIAINSEPVSDALIVNAFKRIESVRGNILLSYFEWAFLVACCVFEVCDVTVRVMEVGLGGRLDAVNVIDADAAIITGIAIDHSEWLGNDIETIGLEKAGVLRSQQVSVFGSSNCPQSIINYAQSIGCNLQCLDDTYCYYPKKEGFAFRNHLADWPNLTKPLLEGDWQMQNAAAVIHCIMLMGYPLTELTSNEMLSRTKLAGRLQQVSDKPQIWVDVAHNAQSAEALASWLEAYPITGQTRAVFSVLKDKQVETWLDSLDAVIDHWFIFELDGLRKMKIDALVAAMADHVKLISRFKSASEAFNAVKSVSQSDDRIIVFGSFHVLDAVLDESQL